MQKSEAAIRTALLALGSTLRAERQALEISQEDFAELSGVHRNYIGRVERAEINPSFDALFRIAAALKIDLSELLRRAKL